MNTDQTDKKGIINKMKNLCLPRPPREPGGPVQIRVLKTYKPISSISNELTGLSTQLSMPYSLFNFSPNAAYLGSEAISRILIKELNIVLRQPASDR